MKNKRRYREKGDPDLFVSGMSKGRIHDFLKGWGTSCKDGSILWDTWRPPTKRQIERSLKRYEKRRKEILDGTFKLVIPMVKAVYPEIKAEDIIGVQPMMTDYES